MRGLGSERSCLFFRREMDGCIDGGEVVCRRELW